MDDDRYYFAGDPATDSPRRHLQRVLEGGEPKRRHWPWIVGLLAGGGSFALWRVLRKRNGEVKASNGPGPTRTQT